MQIDSLLQNTKSHVSDYLQTFLRQTIIAQVSPTGKWSGDAVNKILAISTQGKMLRSSIMFLSNRLFTDTCDIDSLTKASAALELFHTGLLIHDDIMDSDDMRRRLKSIHIQYREHFLRDRVPSADRLGESFSITIGDMVFFMASQILQQITDPILRHTLNTIFFQELNTVASAQMQDVYAGYAKKLLPLKDILTLYTFKTGRYTCGLPLVAGAIIANAKHTTLHRLWKLGTHMGIVFQLRDDTLDLFGNSKKTGKLPASDIRENKQTLYKYFLFKKSSIENQKILRLLFGKSNLSQKNIRYIQTLIEKLNISDDIHAIVQEHTMVIEDIISHLPITKQNQNMFISLIHQLNVREA